MLANAQVLWPIATLLIGVACGTAAFGPEQRDLTYQFLASQHLPLTRFWWYRILFWFSAAVLGCVILAIGWTLILGLNELGRLGMPRQAVRAEPSIGSLYTMMGPVLFFCV